MPAFDPHHCLLALSKSEGSFIGENRQSKSPRLVFLGVEFVKTWSRREGDSGESGGPCSQEPISESAREVSKDCVWEVEVEVEAMAVSWFAVAMFPKASSVSFDRLPKLVCGIGIHGLARPVG